MRGHDTIGKKIVQIHGRDDMPTSIVRTIYHSRVTGRMIAKFEKMFRPVHYSTQFGFYIDLKGDHNHE